MLNLESKGPVGHGDSDQQHCLMDFVNQIQLASKGQSGSINVDYRENSRYGRPIFLRSPRRFKSRIRRAEQHGQPFDWKNGLSHWSLPRPPALPGTHDSAKTSKQMGGIILPTAPTTSLKASSDQIGYHYSSDARGRPAYDHEALRHLRGVTIPWLDLDTLLDQTQRSGIWTHF